MTAKLLKNKLSKKTSLLMSPFGFALAACGGGGNSSQPISDSSNDTNGNANPPESDMSSSLTPLEQLTYNLANLQGPQTQFTPEANTPNEKGVLGLDPANYFDNSNPKSLKISKLQLIYVFIVKIIKCAFSNIFN